jgi:catechol 2,3-dioxygenase-like lactoylglutathione lyase family enzyme
MLSDAAVSAILPTTDLARSRKFYTETLGLKEMPAGVEGFAMFGAGAGTALAVYERAPVTVEHTQAGFLVSNLEEEVKVLKEKGVTFEEYDLPEIKTVDGIATMEGVKSAWFKDPDGNIIALNQM